LVPYLVIQKLYRRSLSFTVLVFTVSTIRGPKMSCIYVFSLDIHDFFGGLNYLLLASLVLVLAGWNIFRNLSPANIKGNMYLQNSNLPRG
jgi:hypothetical protein